MKKFLPKTKNNSSGFTLIELMVVITIIAFLAVIGIVSFTAVQKQARDGRRRADIDAISTAMESNREPVAGTYKAWTDTSIYANTVVPFDPTQTSSGTSVAYNGSTYKYAMISGGGAASTTYAVCALLENATGNAGPTTSITVATACTPATSAPNTGYCYCRSNQQ